MQPQHRRTSRNAASVAFVIDVFSEALKRTPLVWLRLSQTDQYRTLNRVASCVDKIPGIMNPEGRSTRLRPAIKFLEIKVESGINRWVRVFGALLFAALSSGCYGGDGGGPGWWGAENPGYSGNEYSNNYYSNNVYRGYDGNTQPGLFGGYPPAHEAWDATVRGRTSYEGGGGEHYRGGGPGPAGGHPPGGGEPHSGGGGHPPEGGGGGGEPHGGGGGHPPGGNNYNGR